MKHLSINQSKLLRISDLEHKTSRWVRSKINFLIGPQESLPATVRRRKLTSDMGSGMSCVTKASNTIVQGTFEDGQRRCRQRKYWVHNIKERTSLLMPELLMMTCRKDWKRISTESILS